MPLEEKLNSSGSRSQPPCGRPLPAQVGRSPALSPAVLLERLIQKLDAYIEAKGLNYSDARRKILEVIIQEGGHFRAQDLLNSMQKTYPEVGKATLYRNLPVLVESGLIQEGPRDANDQILYELSDEQHHDHIVCTDCKQVFEFHDDSIEAKQSQISKSLGFSVKDHRHVIFASCDLLAKKNKKGSKSS